MGYVSDLLPASFATPEPSARFWVSQFPPVKEHFPEDTTGSERGFQTPRFACKQLCKAKRNSCTPQLIHHISELQFIFSLYWHHSLLGLPMTINTHQYTSNKMSWTANKGNTFEKVDTHCHLLPCFSLPDKLQVKRKGGILAQNEHFQTLFILIEVEKMKNLFELGKKTLI